MNATIGSGSANLSVTSMTGDVTLLARPEPPASGDAARGQAGAPELASDQGQAAEPTAATTKGRGDAR
jgi:hypothetical protein